MRQISDKEPLLCRILLIICILEIPFANLFLISSIILYGVLIVIYRRRPILNIRALVLILFITLYFAIDSVLESSTTYNVSYAMSVICIYLCGLYINFYKNDMEHTSIKIENVVKLIAYTYFIYVIVTVIYSIMSGQMAISRNPLNIWTGKLRAATHYGTMMIFPIAYGIYLSITKVGKRRLIGFAIVLTAIVINIITASRTVLLFVPIGYLICYFYSIKVKGTFTKKHVNQLIGCVLLIVIVLIAFYINAFGIQTELLNSALGQRYVQGFAPKISEDGRMEHWRFFFLHLSNSISGGGYTRLNSGNLHNIYFNIYDLSGILPFILIILFTIMIYKNIKHVIIYDKVSNEVKILLVVVFSLTFLQLLMEPVMESVPVFCWCILYLSGAVTSLDNTVVRYGGIKK